VRGDGFQSASFDIDPEVKHRLLNGLDDIALTLQEVGAIETYERDRERTGPVTTSL
jgi:3-isopropylmalate/(R)-2-methylmalate dehydratase small subunit